MTFKGQPHGGRVIVYQQVVLAPDVKLYVLY